MLEMMFVIAILIEVVFPVVLAFWAVRKLGSSWVVIAFGALAFVVSQIVHIPLVLGLQPFWSSASFTTLSPFLQALFSGLILGLLAGLCEEPMRWLAFKFLREKSENIKNGVVLGIGHGGVESVILVGFSVLSTFVAMISIRDSGAVIPGITPEMVTQYFAMPWHIPLTGALERLTAISIHIGMSVVVWKAVRYRSWKWFLCAILLHTFYDATAVMLSALGASIWAIEGLFIIFAVISIVWTIRTVRAETPVEEDELLPEPNLLT